MKKIILSLSIAAFMFGACQKESEPEKKLPEGGGTQTNTTEQGTASGTLSVKPLTPITVQAEVGGPNQPNQVYIDLSTGKTTLIKRDTWHLAFYCGDDDFRVLINPAIAMSAQAQETTDMTKRIAHDDSMLLNTDPTKPSANHGVTRHLIDDPRGLLKPISGQPGTGTAIEAISAKDDENKVYLLSMGFAISDKAPVKGSVNLFGAHNGWGKVRITREGNAYKVQYAKNTVTNKSDIKTFTVTKNPAYSFVYLNLESGQMVQVTPKKKDWDLCFTTTTGWLSQQYNVQSTVTFYPDIIVTNLHGGTRATFFSPAASLAERDKNYSEYTLEKAKKLDLSKPKYETQIVIGKNWRDMINGGIIRNIYFAIQDGDGNFFKLKMKALKNDAGERGYPVFEYELLK